MVLPGNSYASPFLDIKPANFVLSSQLRLIDFGLSRILGVGESQVIVTDARMTIPYTSPER